MSEGPAGLLSALAGARVEFILVRGFAATAHGSARATYDVDVVYSRSRENIDRLVAALRPHQPYLRGAPPGRLKNLETVAELEALREERERRTP